MKQYVTAKYMCLHEYGIICLQTHSTTINNFCFTQLDNDETLVSVSVVNKVVKSWFGQTLEILRQL